MLHYHFEPGVFPTYNCSFFVFNTRETVDDVCGGTKHFFSPICFNDLSENYILDENDVLPVS